MALCVQRRGAKYVSPCMVRVAQTHKHGFVRFTQASQEKLDSATDRGRLTTRESSQNATNKLRRGGAEGKCGQNIQRDAMRLLNRGALKTATWLQKIPTPKTPRAFQGLPCTHSGICMHHIYRCTVFFSDMYMFPWSWSAGSTVLGEDSAAQISVGG